MENQAVLQKTSDLERMPFGSPPEMVAEVCKRDGGVILTGALSRDEVAATNAELDVAMNQRGKFGFGGDRDSPQYAAFMGGRTKRIAHALKYSPTYRERFLCNPLMMEYAAQVVPGKLGSHALFASHVIEIFPGEDAQVLHRDASKYMETLGLDHREGANLLANTILALTDVDEDMGATRVVPGSHLWEDYSVIPPFEETVPALLNAGDILFFTGSVLHGGGANITRDKSRRVISSAYTVPFFMGEEAWPFVFSVEEVRSFPLALQTALGFRSVSGGGEEPGFLWRVNTLALEEHLDL